MGDRELHAHLEPSIENEIERKTIRVLLGFWLGLAVLGAGFMTSTNFTGWLS